MVLPRWPKARGLAPRLSVSATTSKRSPPCMPITIRSTIAPDAAHAQHMPSHIFTRVGYWKESIESNAVAARVAKSDKELHDELHAMDYLVYAYLQLGQDAKARAVIDEMRTVSGFAETFIPGPFALAASPARYAVERGDWKAATALEVRPNPL